MGGNPLALVANITLVALSIAMGGMLLKQYTARPRSHTLYYALGLFILAMAAYPEVYHKLSPDGTVPFPLWWLYWICGSSTVGFLAVGTAYLFSPKWGKAALISVAVLSLLVIVATVLTAGDGPTAAAGFGKAPTWQIKVPFLIQNIVGSLLIFGGAAWSFYKTKGLYNIWIALGTLLFASGGSASGLANISGLFYFTQTAGILLLSLGVFQSTRGKRPKSTVGA